MPARTNPMIAIPLTLHAFIIWAVCGLTVALGREFLGLETALKVHAIAAPLSAVLVSLAYFNRLHAASPLRTAAFFLAFVIILDATVVAPVFEKSYAMFSSLLGTWLPFLSIFAATYLMGVWVVRHRLRS